LTNAPAARSIVFSFFIAISKETRVLSGPEQLAWVEAFFQAFNAQEFAGLLTFRLDDNIGNYASPADPVRVQIENVIAAYQRRDLEEDLIARAIELRPRNGALAALARSRKAVAAPDDVHLERLIRETNSFLDFGKWLERANLVQVCVCRIEIQVAGGQVFGTGFLVGPDLLLTNYHVMEPVVAFEDGPAGYTGPRARATDVVCRFDYKVLDSGAVNDGSKYRLAPAWRVALSPNDPGTRDPNPDELDFALVRLAERVGDQPLGARRGVPGDARRWISRPAGAAPPALAAHSPLFIVQHPEGAPIKLALDSDGIQTVDAARTRVRYSTNTEPGSSGSPCFDENWTLVAIHHSGSPDFRPTFNEGIPIDSIASDLTGRGIAGVFTPPTP